LTDPGTRALARLLRGDAYHLGGIRDVADHITDYPPWGLIEKRVSLVLRKEDRPTEEDRWA
jgi:hypothetical protein